MKRWSGCRLENKSQEVEGQRIGDEILAYQIEQAFQKNYMKVGVKKLLRAGMMPARTWGAHAVGMSPTER